MSCDSGFYQSVSRWLKAHIIVASVIVIFCSLGVRLFLTLQSDQAMLVTTIQDARGYLAPAQNLLKHGAFLNGNNSPDIRRTPGYPTFVAGIMYLVGEDWRDVLTTQAILLSFTVVISYWTARMIFSPVTAFVGALLAAFSPWGAVHAGLPLSEGLYLLVLSLTFLLIKLAVGAMRRSSILLGGMSAGLLTAAAVMVRPLWPLVILISLGMFVLYGPKKKEAWLLLATMLVFSITPLILWKERNRAAANFNGFATISGEVAWVDLASRVTALVNGQDRWAVKKKTILESRTWKLSPAEADAERWRRAKAVFREHPIATVYCFFLNAAETALHPSRDVLWAANLNFQGDFWILGSTWGGLLGLAFLGFWSCFHSDAANTNCRWVYAILGTCMLLTLAGGAAFGQGARYRAPLELIVPFLAAEGLLRAIRIGLAKLPARQSLRRPRKQLENRLLNEEQ